MEKMKMTLCEGLPRLGIELDEQTVDTLCAFGTAVVEQNKVMNLTAITEPDQVAKLHLLDSLSILAVKDLRGKRMVDVGCGAGFPGVPLKIALPESHVTLLDSLNIAPTALRQLLVLAEKYDLPIEFSLDSKLYLTEHSLALQQDDDHLVFHRDTILANHGRIVVSLEPFCLREVEKVNLLCIPEESRDAVVKELEAIAVSAVWSSRNCMEITHPDADKGRGLGEICRILNIPEESTMALGDSGNDIAMLRRAGLGVAMGNAPDFVKAAADVISDRYDEDGAAKAIERWALK